MKTIIYIIVQSAKTDNGEFKNILGTYTLRFQARERFTDICVEFDNKEDSEGNFVWNWLDTFGDVANFKRMSDGISMRIELIEREVEI